MIRTPVHDAIEDQILSNREAPIAWSQLVTFPPGLRVVSEQSEMLHQPVDESIRRRLAILAMWRQILSTSVRARLAKR